MKQPSILLLLLLLAAALLASCRTTDKATDTRREQQVRTDTLRILSLRADTIRLHDSVFVREQVIGCTVRIEQHHWHTAWQTRILRDTVLSVRRDTLRVASNTEKIRSPTPALPTAREAIAVLLLALAAGAGFYFHFKHKNTNG